MFDCVCHFLSLQLIKSINNCRITLAYLVPAAMNEQDTCMSKYGCTEVTGCYKFCPCALCL